MSVAGRHSRGLASWVGQRREEWGKEREERQGKWREALFRLQRSILGQYRKM